MVTLSVLLRRPKVVFKYQGLEFTRSRDGSLVYAKSVVEGEDGWSCCRSVEVWAVQGLPTLKTTGGPTSPFGQKGESLHLPFTEVSELILTFVSHLRPPCHLLCSRSFLHLNGFWEDSTKVYPTLYWVDSYISLQNVKKDHYQTQIQIQNPCFGVSMYSYAKDISYIVVYSLLLSSRASLPPQPY